MIEDFILRAFIGGTSVATISGPLGCFVVWRRIAYFGATMSHSALLGVALGIAAGADPTVGTVTVCIAIALIVVFMESGRLLASDTLMGILAHSALAYGVAAIALMPGVRVDLMGYLFGDVLAIGRGDLQVIAGIGLVLGAGIWAFWRPLLSVTVDEELARVEGVRATVARIALMLMLALLVAVGMKVVGILLIVSLLVIPPAAARMISATPEGMALNAALLAAASVILGMILSLTVDVPAGPAIVIVASLFFALLYLSRRAFDGLSARGPT
ncbi:MAG: metal ABC transporter permease [Rhodospirillaceae bacterium]|nr:metal ABC transporter permease [Rhodospirillaceae bacterium]